MGNLGNRLHSAPFLRLLVPFIVGIIIAEWLIPPKSYIYFIFPIICTLSLLILRRSSYKNDFVTGLLALVIFLSLGFSIALNNRYIPEKLAGTSYYAILDDFPVEKGKYYRTIVRLIDRNIKVLTYFEKTDELSYTQPGTPLYFQGCPELIKNQGNPFEFDYESYSIRNRIGHRIYLKVGSYRLIHHTKILNLQRKALILREKLLKRLADSGVKGETFHVISAITLGSRDNLDPETTQSFTRTGTLHVLAVSGGNIAVIFLLLNFLFYFLKKHRAGVTLHTLIILSGIWGYALITGLSPSVLRAATMFTFIAVGNNFSRKPDIYNSLAASAFLLMCLNPSLFFDVGFQLSYAAVISIVFLQPVIYKSCYCKHWIVDRVWLILSISLAAQIGTLPFSLYYFHQFPSYFWLSNTVVVPLVSVLLYLTFFVIATVPYVPLLGLPIAHFLSWIGDQMLEFLKIIEKMPFAVIENLYPQAYQLILMSLSIILAAIFVIYKKWGIALAALSIVALILFLNDLSYYSSLSRKEVIVFNISGKTLLAFTLGRETTWLTSEKPTSFEELNYFTKPYTDFRRIKKQYKIFLSDTSFQSITNLIQFKNFINFQGLKICLLNDKLIKPGFLRGFPKPDVGLLTEIRNANQPELFKNCPETMFINTRSPVSFNKGELLFGSVEESGAIVIAIQGLLNDDKIKFRTRFFNN
jgi:competence protein ComEC